MEDKKDVSDTVHHSANQVALEAARRDDVTEPAKTYKEVYGEVYDFLISKHENKS